MKVFSLLRMVDGPDFTLGRIEDDQSQFVVATTERAWVDVDGNGLGDTNKSRIPAGTFECHRAMHHGKYEVWCLENVPGRKDIHVHIGNDPRVDSLGCPLVGSDFGPNGTVKESGAAFRKWMKATEGESKIVLIVKDVPPLQAERVA